MNTETALEKATANEELQTAESPAVAQGSFYDRMSTLELIEGTLKPKNGAQLWWIARIAKGSSLVDPKWSESDVFLILVKGLRLGFDIGECLDSLYIVNHRVSIFGDGPKALVEASGLLADYTQEEIGTYPEDGYGWKVTSLRKGRVKPIVTTYTMADAKIAKVFERRGRDGQISQDTAWFTAPKRMLMFRARGFNLRDNFPDVLRGVAVGELQDFEPGFEHAKPATGRIVEPNFDGKPAATPPVPDTLPMPEPAKRRGRPPNPVPAAPPAPLAPQPPAEKPIPPAPEQPAAAAPPTPEQPAKDLFPPAEKPANSLAQVKAWLMAEKLSLAGFLGVMERNEYLKPGGKLEDVDPAGLELALRKKQAIAEHLRAAEHENSFP